MHLQHNNIMHTSRLPVPQVSRDLSPNPKTRTLSIPLGFSRTVYNSHGLYSIRSQFSTSVHCPVHTIILHHTYIFMPIWDLANVLRAGRPFTTAVVHYIVHYTV